MTAQMIRSSLFDKPSVPTLGETLFLRKFSSNPRAKEKKNHEQQTEFVFQRNPTTY